MKMTARIAGAVIAALTLVVASLITAPPAASAQLTEVTGFGTNPTNLRMHLYVPDGIPARPALLVGCVPSGASAVAGPGRCTGRSASRRPRGQP
ncbi:hypothetical protein ACQEVF_33045 [Nonomuraea polychroma]|uniref:hypothetical protein n=1 Tax=Nonomuraea polychroma TaxID=46176 RepID=UPI003D8E6751